MFQVEESAQVNTLSQEGAWHLLGVWVELSE